MKFADDLKEEACESLEALSRFKVYEPKVKVDYGGIKVTPYPISHSAVDAYMFVIECDGKRILHTGDFRDHGYGAKELLRDVENEVGNIDVLITEGTLLNRDNKRMISEKELQDKAYQLFKEYNYAFVLCSSMDADRIVSFFMASQHCSKNRRFIADSYQIEQIKNLKQLPDPYNQLFAYPYGKGQESEWERMKQRGFTMLVRNTDSFRKKIHETMTALHLNPKEVLFIYSMFDGYVNPLRTKIFKKELYDFTHLYNWNYIPLHTSGHASKEALQAICEHVNPKKAIIPIHKEELGLLGKLDMDIHCPIVESTQVIDDINIIIK
jgi:ribonuclease J